MNNLHLLLLLLTIQSSTSIQLPINCTQQNSHYNYLTHTCQLCPTATSVSPDKLYCNCTMPFYQNLQVIGFNADNSCIELPGANSQIISMHNVDGLYDPQPVTCSVQAYQNVNKTRCIPCGFGMRYNSVSLKCECIDPNQYIIGQACFNPSTQPTSSFTQGSLNQQLYNKAQVGCLQSNNQDSCQILLNMCSKNNYLSNSFCDLLSQIPASNTFIPTYSYQSTYLQQNLNIYASSQPGTNTTTVKNTLQFKLFEYNIYGQLVDIKPFTDQVLPCRMNDQDLIQFQSFGLNLYKRCEVGDGNGENNRYYDMFVINSEGNYVNAPIRYPNGNINLYRRFTLLADSTAATMTFRSSPPLTVPVLNYTTSADTISIQTQSTTTTLSFVLLAPFIVFNVGILVIFIINFYKYMKYNPDQTNDPYFVFKAILIFFLMALKHWGLGLWIFLLGVSTYMFCFFKFQETVYLLLPNLSTQYFQYYDPFLAVFYVQFSFVLISYFLLIYDISGSTDYFLIDWEKEKDLSNFDIKMGQQKKQASVWRKILLVNQLYQLTINRIINIQFVVLFSLLFLKGLNWINLSYQIPNTTHLADTSNSSAVINPVLGYFIITFIVFIIAILQYIFRNLIKIWQPLPYQDFVDLCSISNISLIVFDEALHGYYIHGMNPLGQAQGSLQYIQSVFQKQARSFGKSRAFQNDDPDKIQVFEVSFPFKIRQKFQMQYKNRYQQKLVGRTLNPSFFSKPIPEMMDENDYKQIQGIHNDMLESFKYYLEGVKTSQFNVKERGFLSKIFSCPDDAGLIGQLPIFYKDYWHEFTNVLMSGHEFFLLVYVLNFINIFYIATQNIFISVFITMLLTRILRIVAQNTIKRTISKHTLIDDKFFN